MTKEEINKFIGEKINSIRTKKNISSECLIDYLKISRPSIINIEKGRQSASIDILIKMSYLLKCDVNSFIPSAEMINANIQNEAISVYKKSAEKKTEHLKKQKQRISEKIKQIEDQIINQYRL